MMYKLFKSAALLIAILIVFSGFVAFDIRLANDFPFVSKEMLIEGFRLPQIWSLRTAEGLGEYVVSTLWAWPVDFLYALGSAIGFSFSILERFFGVFPILIIGVISIYKLSRHLSIKNWYIPAIFYLINTYILLIIDGGQFAIGLAYSWMPIAYLSFIKALKGDSKKKILAGLAITMLGFFDIRFIYVLFIILFLRFIYSYILRPRKIRWSSYAFIHFKNYFFTVLVVGLIFAGLNAYWLIPAVLANAPTLPATYQRVMQTSFLSFANMGHAMFLLQPHWYKNVFGKITPLKAEFVLIPILVFLAPVLVFAKKQREKANEIGFWLFVALVGIFLVKGANPPLPNLYPWLFGNIPGFSLFRDPTKFFFLIALSYSVLIGFTVDTLIKRFNWSLKISEAWRFALGNWSLKIIPLILTSYFIILIKPVWLGRMTGTFAEPVNKDKYFSIINLLKNDTQYGRTLWIPSRSPLGYSSPTHPSVNALQLTNKRPFAIGTVGTYELFNFLREAPFMGELFDIAAIKYIAYPYPDVRREELKQDNIEYYYNFSEQIESLDWIDEKITQPPVQLFKTKNNQNHFFITPKTFLVVGSDDIYKDLVEQGDFKLSDNALVFSEESPNMGKYSDYSNSVILKDKTLTDFVATFIEKDKFIFPAEYLDFDPSTSSEKEGWWKREAADFLWWRDFLQQKYTIDNQDFDYGGGYAIAEGNRKFQIPPEPFGTGQGNSKFQKDNILLARVMVSSRGGRASFYQGNTLIGEIITKSDTPEKIEIKLTGYAEIPDQYFEYDKTDFLWFEVGKLAIDHQSLTIQTEGDINVINSLTTIPEDEWKRINELIHKYKVYNWNELTVQEKEGLFKNKNDIKVSYEKIAPTHYQVEIKGLKEPVTLAFSETYDSLWKAGNKGSYPLYGLINGFYIEEDGVYDIYFSAQKYIYPGLVISILTAASLLVYLLISKRKTKI